MACLYVLVCNVAFDLDNVDGDVAVLELVMQYPYSRPGCGEVCFGTPFSSLSPTNDDTCIVRPYGIGCVCRLQCKDGYDCVFQGLGFGPWDGVVDGLKSSFLPM